MNSRQISLNIGAPVNKAGVGQALLNFAHMHGRFLPRNSQGSIAAGIQGGRTVRRKSGKAEYDFGDAFEIFPSKAKEDHILDKRGDE